MDAPLAGLSIEEEQARTIVLNDGSQAATHGSEQVGKVEMGHDRVVHLEQQLLTITLFRQLAMSRLCALVVQDVVHGNRNLLCHLLHKVELGVLVGSRLQTPKAHGTETPLRG